MMELLCTRHIVNGQTKRSYPMKRLRLFAVLILASLLIPQSAGSAQADLVRTYLQTLIDQNAVPGLAVVVIQRGEVKHRVTLGLADRAANTAVTPNTRFESASLVKPFVAMATLLLVQDGKIDLDAPLKTYLAEAPSAWDGVTLRQILSHSAGLPYEVPRIASDLACRVLSESDLLKRATAQPLMSAPGTQYSYSDLGYQLASIVIARVSGRSRNAFVQERIFTPLNMPDATFLSADGSTSSESVAQGYQKVDGQFVLQSCSDQAGVGEGATDLYLSLEDLIAWEKALRTSKLLRPDLLELMQRPVPFTNGTSSPFAVGWQVGIKDGVTLMQHGGGSNGVTHRVLRILPNDLTIVVLTNVRLSQAQQIAYTVAGLVDPSLTKALQPDENTVNDPEPEVSAFLRAFIRAVREGMLTKDQFTPEMQISFDDLMALKSDFQALGEPLSISLVERADNGLVRMYKFRVRFTVGTGLVELSLTPDNKIAYLNIGL
jgi:CubicO group peptidase (beta-lactamase class C family)